MINSVNPASGGPAEGLKQLAQIYHGGGHELTVATLDSPEVVDQFKFPAPVFGLGPGVGTYSYTPRALPWLRANIAAYDIVFLNCIWQYNTLAGYRALSETNTPYGVFTHGMLDPYFRINFPLKHVKKSIYWHLFLRRVLNNANAVLFTCEEEKILARNAFGLYKVRERVLNYGIFGPEYDVEDAKREFFEKWPSLRGKRLVITMGRLHPKKGIDLLIHAFAQSLASDPNWCLAIAGPDQVGQQAELQTLAEKLGVADRITWTGMISGAIKWGALAASEIFALPSHQENFGIVVAEALASKVPVIISDKVNIWREIEDHNAGIICHDNVESARDALNRWITLKEDVRTEMRSNSLKCFNECFNYHLIAGRVLQMTETISSESRHR